MNINQITKLIDPTWLTGPIFGKELLVTSRRKRYYLLRSLYVVALSIFIVMAWAGGVYTPSPGPAALKTALMAEAGRTVIVTIIWFQFVTAQIIATVSLAGAISDEIYYKTLPVLITTPITSLQIVLGKLSSRLLHTFLLLAISLPLLAIVRVFGGIPWDYVIQSLAITITATIFTASLTLLFSIYSNKANDAIVKTFSVCFLLYSILPGAFTFLATKYSWFHNLKIISYYFNPWIALITATRSVMNPRVTTPIFYYLPHCAVMLSVSAFLLFIAVVSVRRTATKRLAGRASIFTAIKERMAAKRKTTTKITPERHGKIRFVKGHPIIWKEMRIAIIKGHWIKTLIGTVFAGVIIITIYAISIYNGILSQKETQIGFVMAYFSVALLGTAFSAAACISSEKQAQTWPILMTLALDEKQILKGKILGSILRIWPFWLILTIHFLIFTLAGFIHWIALPYMLILVIASTLLVSSIGTFISSLFKRTSTAQTVTLICILLFGTPFCCAMPFFIVSPVTLAAIMLTATAGFRTATTPVSELDFVFSSGYGGLLYDSAIFIAIITMYLFIAYLFFAITKNTLRNKIF
jgi:ABC-type transport system involved in multi-copper enzyme maturation permease subunit